MNDIPLRLYRTPSLIRHQHSIESARNALEKRRALIAIWNKDTFLFPKVKIDKYRRADIPLFPLRLFIAIIFLTVILVPGWFILFFFVRREFNYRKSLKRDILTQERMLRGILPIPLPDDDLNELADQSWGQDLLESGIIFRLDPLD